MSFYLRDDEELVDQKKFLEERCKPQCVKPLYEYEVSTLFSMEAQNLAHIDILIDTFFSRYRFTYGTSSITLLKFE